MNNQPKSIDKTSSLFLIGVVFFILLLPFLSAATENAKLYEITNLKFTCTLNSAIPSPTTTYNITLSSPSGSTLLNNVATTAQGNGAFNYTYKFSTTGLYKVQMFCTDGTYSFSDEGFYDVSPTGKPSSSFLNNPILIILGVLGLILVIAGASLGIPWFGFIASIMFLLVGIYTMIYGFDNVTNLYTQGSALVFLGMGIIFMFLSVWEWVENLGEGGDTLGGEEED
jgi:hypothetical protein